MCHLQGILTLSVIFDKDINFDMITSESSSMAALLVGPLPFRLSLAFSTTALKPKETLDFQPEMFKITG